MSRRIERALVLGANSAVAEALCRRLAADGAQLTLVARDEAQLRRSAEDLRVRGARAVAVVVLDVLDEARLVAELDHALAADPPFDLCLVAHGSLPDEPACAHDPARMREALRVNGEATLVAMARIALAMERARHGTLAVIGSVAGDRGRAGNATYGAAKAAVAAYASGLRQRLAPLGVRVLTVKPGFIDTPMTAHIAGKGPLWATPDRVARDIFAAVVGGRRVLYTPWFWAWIMRVLRALPERVFERLRI